LIITPDEPSSSYRCSRSRRYQNRYLACRTALDLRRRYVIDFPCPRSGKHDPASKGKRPMISAKSDMTIRDIRVTMLRLP
jgi:hypothetical protein